ncbi:MAG: D-alanyl-D-alanine carboxypeptidase [Halieaceae bacterium]|nr:D-alanyl-D-alanine carboxypeptidase [Halieaceae bacterium]
MQKLLATVAALGLSVSVSAAIIPASPEVAARAHYLIDASTGYVIAESNANELLPPASLTKLMTSYVLSYEIERGRVAFDDKVLISENAWAQNPTFKGSSLMWLEPGMEVSIRDVEKGIVISSGNDATVAIAEHLAGNEAAFADMMNTHAQRLGMNDSYFENSHGLPSPNHLATAHDLALLAKAIIQDFPTHYEIYAQRDYTFNNIKQYNRNTLLSEDPSVDGLKTGYTSEAGYGLVSSAKRGDMRLISVVLGTNSAKTRASETRSLLNYGFRYFETAELLPAEREMEKPEVWMGLVDYLSVGVLEVVTVTLPRGERRNIEQVVSLNEPLSAPIKRGDEVGRVSLSLDGKEIYEGPVVALQDAAEAGFFARLWDRILMWIDTLLSPEPTE